MSTNTLLWLVISATFFPEGDRLRGPVFQTSTAGKRLSGFLRLALGSFWRHIGAGRPPNLVLREEVGPSGMEVALDIVPRSKKTASLPESDQWPLDSGLRFVCYLAAAFADLVKVKQGSDVGLWNCIGSETAAPSPQDAAELREKFRKIGIATMMIRLPEIAVLEFQAPSSAAGPIVDISDERQVIGYVTLVGTRTRMCEVLEGRKTVHARYLARHLDVLREALGRPWQVRFCVRRVVVVGKRLATWEIFDDVIVEPLTRQIGYDFPLEEWTTSISDPPSSVSAD